MINWISNWAQGIIVAVIIGTIIEMVLPEGNCKKYVKVVIGIYILFSIISPVISKMTGKTLQVSDILELDKYIENVENNNLYGTLDKDNTNNIKEIYINSLKNDIKYKIEAKGYTVRNVELEVQKNEEYTLKNISIEIYKKEEKEENVQNETSKIETINIDISQNTTRDNSEKEKISESEKKKLREYISMVYEISEKNININ